MAKDLNNILLSTIEENKIKEKTPDKLPLNPTAAGWSGQEVRRFLAKSLIDKEGSFLAEFKKKMTEIKTQFEDVFGQGDGDIQGQIDSIIQNIDEVELTASSLTTTVLNNYNELNNLKVDKTLTILDIDLEDNITLSEFKTALGDATTFANGLMSALDKQNLAQTMIDIQSLFSDKADETALAVTDQNIVDLQNNKVPKTTTIIGLDLQDNILIGEFRTALGNATQSVAGLLSAEDKTHLDGLVALLATDDANSVVDTIGEILAIFENYPEGANILEVLNDKVDKIEGKGLSENDYTDIDKNKVGLSYTHSEIADGSNPHNTKFINIADKPTTRDGYGITDVYKKPETYTQQEINALLDNLSAVKGLKSTLLTPTELVDGSNIPTISLNQNGAYVVFTATNTSTGEIDSDTVPVSTIIAGKKFVFFDNQNTVFTIGETNSTFETSENIKLKINLLYLTTENVQAIDVDFDGSLTNYLLTQTNVQETIKKIDNELKTTNTNLTSHKNNTYNPHSVTKNQIGLENVDNTSDLDKPISTATQSALDNKVDNVTGKGLSTNDYTTTEKNKLLGIEAGAEKNVAETDPIFTAWNKSTGINITKSQVSDLIEATQALSGLMSATDKQRLDVLHSLLEEDTENDVVDSINEVLAIFNNYPEGADLVTALAGKVDKVSGKGLSSNDYTNNDKNKLDNIYNVLENIYSKPQLDNMFDDKVDKNANITAGTHPKITYDAKGLVTGGEALAASDIPNLPPTKITQDASNRFVTDVEKAYWDEKVDKVSGMGLSSNDFTTTEKNKLSGIQAGAQVNAVTTVAGRTGAVVLAKADVGLGNVDNTSDLSKPISTAQQTALDNKVDKTSIVDNLTTNDATKPLSAKQGKVLQDNKVDKTLTILGLDLQNNILIGEFRTALGNATQSVAGLLSSEDKTHLDVLVALLETSDDNNVVDTIGEILAIFQNYPEGADLVTALAGKVDKVSGKGLSTNDFTNNDKNKLDGIEEGAQVNTVITKAEIEAKLTGEITSHSHDDRYYTETEIDTKLVGKANATHTHTKSQITDFPTSMPPTAHSTDLLTSGTLGVARGGTGRTDGYAVGVVETRASVLTKIWTGTQAQYDAVGTKDANTLYFII